MGASAGDHLGGGPAGTWDAAGSRRPDGPALWSVDVALVLALMRPPVEYRVRDGAAPAVSIVPSVAATASERHRAATALWCDSGGDLSLCPPSEPHEQRVALTVHTFVRPLSHGLRAGTFPRGRQ